jgi:sensor domain CHASE-containing protein
LNAITQHFKEYWSIWIWSLFLFCAIPATLFIMESTEKKRYQAALRQSILEQLSTARARLEGEFNTELSLSNSIITEIVTNTDISKERFFKITHHFMKSAKHIRNIGLAKNTILSYVYPEKGNENVIGLDYTKIPLQWPAVERAIRTQQIVVAGPLKLVQGGVGIIGRTPIYVDSENKTNMEETYFGILSVVLDIPSLYKAAGIDKLSSLYNIAIRGKDGKGADGEIFFGSENVFFQNPVLIDVTLPGGKWQMAAIPSEGWTPGSELIVRYRLLAIAIIVVISSLLYIQSRGITRRKTIEQEREALIEKLQSSLAEIKTLSGLLPICSHCKKIRDDRGYWNTLEKYIHDHSDATFSHGICQECSDKIYGDEDWYIKMKKKKSGN